MKDDIKKKKGINMRDMTILNRQAFETVYVPSEAPYRILSQSYQMCTPHTYAEEILKSPWTDRILVHLSFQFW